MRLSVDEWGLQLAELTARRGTCHRRKVGAVALNARRHVVATGYNGVASGQPHCNLQVLGPKRVVSWNDELKPATAQTSHYPHACPGAFAASGTQLDGCLAIHAEQNLLIQCRDVYEIDTLYVTASPCITCAKLLLNTSCRRIVFREEYPHAASRDLWLAANREWHHVPRA